MAEQSLKDKTVKGVGWSFADSFLGQGITFLVGLILARLLSPEEYGLIGIIMIFVCVLNGIVDSGLSNAVIRNKDANDDDYNTLFIANMILSIVMCVSLFCCSGLIAQFFQCPELVPLTKAMSVVVILNALSIVQVTILTKNIDFKNKTKASLLSAIVSGIVGITMAVAGCGVWALVGQQLSKQLLYSVSLWIFNKWRPRLCFNLESFLHMWSFGWKLLLSGLLNNIWNQLYQVVVGKFYSPSMLGQYSRSNQFACIFSENLTTVAQRVSFPVLCEVKDDARRLKIVYKKIIKVCMFATVVSLFALGAVSEPLIYCLIGPQWHEAATYLPIICLSYSLYPLQAVNLSMLQVQGRSDLFLILEIAKKVVAIGPLLIGIYISIYWMLVVSVLAGIIAYFLNSYYSGKALKYSSIAQLKDVAPSYLVGSTVAVSVYFLKYLPLSNWVILPLQVIVGAVVFFMLMKAFKLEEYVEIKAIVISYINKLKINR